MESCGTSDRIKNICAIVQERDNILLEKEIKIKYYKNGIKDIEKEIEQLQKESKDLDEENAFFDQVLEFQEVIKESLKTSQEVTLESLQNHQILQEIYDKERETREEECKRVKQECQKIYGETKEMLQQHPLYQEMEEAKAEYLKIDIIRRLQEVKIRDRQRIQKQRLEIDKRLFYNLYIEMAETYVLGKKMEELEEIKRKEMEGIKLLYDLQQQLVLKHKLGTPSDGVKKLTKMTFGSQDSQVPKTVRKVEQEDPKKEPIMFCSKKLSSMFATQNEQQMEIFAVPQPPATMPKVHVISNTIISAPPPTLQPPTFVASPDKRKSKFVMKRKWQKLLKTSNDSAEWKSRESISQESETNCLSQPHLSQNSQQQLNRSTQQQTTETVQQPLLTQLSQQNSQPSNVGSSQLSGQSVLTLTSILNENTPKSTAGGILLNPLISANDLPTKSNKPLAVPNQQLERGPKGVCEPTKTVRFNLEGIDQQQQRKQKQHVQPESIFGNSGPSIFGNTFRPFRNDYADVSQGPFNTSFSIPIMEQTGTNFNAGLEFSSGETQQQITKSPDFSYEMEPSADQQSFKATEISSFGGGSVGGGFFSFPKFNPF